MKLKLAALALVVGMSGPAIAQHYHPHIPNIHHHHHRHGGQVAGAIIGGIVIGAMLNQASQARTAPIIVQQPPYIPPPVQIISPPAPPVAGVCRSVTAIEHDALGREIRYPITVCN